MPDFGQFPTTRLRRNRRTPWLRNLVCEQRLHSSDLIWPVFIEEGTNHQTDLASLPGVSRFTIDRLCDAATQACALGIRAIALFPAIDNDKKTPLGEEAYHDNNLVCRAIQALKACDLDMGIIADVALDPYTSHGQDGIVVDDAVHNDQTVAALCKQALVLAEAGCDIVAPSDMMDGRVGAIRQALDNAGFIDTGILSYAAKYASALYAPFRQAVGSAKHLAGGDKKTYQMAISAGDEAVHEAMLDVHEGADMLMVKPASSYLDIVYRISQASTLPVLAYQVSGEYRMIYGITNDPNWNPQQICYEALLSCKRAGARAIFTYAALDIARLLAQPHD